MNTKVLLTDYNKALALTLLFTFIYKIILSFQGFDLCDEGFVLAFYQQIFNCPSSVEYQLTLFYFEGIIGGIWNSIFGFGGILSFRILAIIVILLTIYFTSLSLKNLIKPIMIPVATSLILLLHSYGAIVFHHNYLSALLAVITVYFLLQGLKLNRPWYLFTAALFCGINIFSRLSNVTMIALVFLLFIDFYYEKNKQLLSRNLLICIIGFITGVGVIILLIFLLGHKDIIKDGIEVLYSLGANDENPHGISNLIKVYLVNLRNIFIFMTVFVFNITFFPLIYRFFKPMWIKIIVIILFSLITIMFSLFAFNSEKFYAIILFPLILSCFIDRKNKSIILINIASLIVLFLLPFGSDAAVRNMGLVCVWPATFTAAAHVYRFIQFKLQSNNASYRLFFIVFYILYCIYGLYAVSRGAYFDYGPRWEKLYRANNNKFTVFTTEAKAVAIDDLLLELRKYVQKDDYLFCFESLPMIHYLTETKPYIGNPWAWSYEYNFIGQLKKSVENIPLPIVLRQKCQPIGGNWTIPYSEEQTNKIDNFFYRYKNIDFFEKFLEDNQYIIVWENDLFRIYVPFDFNFK